MDKKYQITFDPEVAEVLYQNTISLVLSTYQAGKVMVIGSINGDSLHQIPFSFKKPMGIALEGSKMAIAGLLNKNGIEARTRAA